MPWGQAATPAPLDFWVSGGGRRMFWGLYGWMFTVEVCLLSAVFGASL